MITKAIETESGYYVTYDGGRVLSVPNAPGNRHYQELMAWSAEGNIIEPYVAPPVPPITVSPWQFRQALNQSNLRQQVEDAVLNSTDIEVKDGWGFATEFREDNPIVKNMAQVIGVTEADLHNLFELARTL